MDSDGYGLGSVDEFTRWLDWAGGEPTTVPLRKSFDQPGSNVIKEDWSCCPHDGFNDNGGDFRTCGVGYSRRHDCLREELYDAGANWTCLRRCPIF